MIFYLGNGEQSNEIQVERMKKGNSHKRECSHFDNSPKHIYSLGFSHDLLDAHICVFTLVVLLMLLVLVG